MVVVHTDSGNMRIEAPCNGNFSTEAQQKKVDELAGEWLDSKMSKPGAGTAHGEITIREGKSVDDGVEIRFITVSVDGALSRDEAVAGAGLIGDWVGKTGKKDAAKASTAPVKTATPPANTGKTTPPADTSKTTPPANTGKTTSPAKATKDTGTHWDNNLSVDENLERLWNSAG
jgi:hypothetical protein